MPFTSSTVANMIGWMKADSDSLFQDLDGSVPAASDGDPVLTWYDTLLSGLFNFSDTAVPVVVSPRLKVNQINGFNCVRFAQAIAGNPLDTFDIDHASQFPQPLTFYLVMRQNLHGGNSPGGASVFYGFMDTYQGTAGTSLYQYQSSPELRLYQDISPSFQATTTDLALGAWGIVRCIFDGSNSNLRINKGTVNAAPLYGTGGIHAGFLLGDYGGLDALYGYSFDITEMLIYNQHVGSSDDPLVMAYLQSRFGLAASSASNLLLMGVG